jgi:hypothetical protein
VSHTLITENVGEAVRLLRILARGRLIEEKGGGMDGQRPRQLHQPPGAGREGVGACLRDTIEMDPVEEPVRHLVHRFAPVGEGLPCAPAADGRRDPDVLADREGAEELQSLEGPAQSEP